MSSIVETVAGAEITLGESNIISVDYERETAVGSGGVVSSAILMIDLPGGLPPGANHAEDTYTVCPPAYRCIANISRCPLVAPNPECSDTLNGADLWAYHRQAHQPHQMRGLRVMLGDTGDDSVAQRIFIPLPWTACTVELVPLPVSEDGVHPTCQVFYMVRYDEDAGDTCYRLHRLAHL